LQRFEVFGAKSELNRVTPGGLTSGKTIPVRMEPLDALLSRMGWQGVDLLKIDTEGYELDVLEGAKRTVEAGVGAILAECTFSERDRWHTPFLPLFTWVTERRYELVGLYDVHHLGGAQHYSNAMFVRTGGGDK
jgi:hypothetical protein